MRKQAAAVTVALMALVAVVLSARPAGAMEKEFGLKTGFNLARTVVTMAGETTGSGPKLGITFGASIDLAVKDDVSLETGVQFAMKGGREGAAVDRIGLVEVPALAGFKFGEGKGYALAGMNLGLVVSAVDQAGRDFRADLNALNLDLVAGVGGLFKDGKLKVGLVYELGLTDLSVATDVDMRLRNLQVVMTYVF